MKFCYITDVHFRESTPINRKDSDILNTLEKKFLNLKELCKKENVDFIVHGGDLGHNWDWKLSLLNRVDRIIKNLEIPFYSIIGNHDVPGKNILEYPNTGLAFLEKLQSVKIFHPTKTSLGEWDFYGYHSDTPECEEILNGKNFKKDPDRVSVAICHAPVGRTGLGHEIHYKKVGIQGFDLAFFGDIHSGFPLWKNPKGVLLGNPGSFFRQSLTDSKQPVGCYIVENKDVKFVVLEEANPSLFKLKQKITTVFQTTKEIKNLNTQKINDYKLFDKVAKDLKIPKSKANEYYEEYMKL